MIKKNVTLKDVAHLAGVSTATVTRVLRKEGYIAEKTREMVEQAIQQTGYRVNTVAQGLRTQRTKTIGHLLQGISPNLFYAGVELGAEQEALQHGWSILTINVQRDPVRERLGVETLIQRRVDAILFTTPIDPENVQIALDAGLEVVQVERPTTIPTAMVTVDNYVGSLAAVEHLISLGHSRIAYIGEEPVRDEELHALALPNYVERERFSGYCDALAKHQLSLDPQLIVLGKYYTSADNGSAEGYNCMKKIFQAKERPGAVFVTSDIIASGALQALYEARMHIPDAISVIGFDNTYSPYLSPALTTVEQPMEQIGRAAVQIILRRFQKSTHEGEQSEHIRLKTRLIERASTGPVPK